MNSHDLQDAHEVAKARGEVGRGALNVAELSDAMRVFARAFRLATTAWGGTRRLRYSPHERDILEALEAVGVDVEFAFPDRTLERFHPDPFLALMADGIAWRREVSR